VQRKTILLLVIIGLVALAVYVYWTPARSSNPDFQTKGEEQTPYIAYASLATAVISFLTALVGLLKQFMDRKS
jgi:hypothetical protein